MMYKELDIEEIKMLVEASILSGKDFSITIVKMKEDVSLIIHEGVTPTQICNQMSDN